MKTKKIEIKEMDTTSLKGLRKAFKLKDKGWTITNIGWTTTSLKRYK
jgi:hypothetical protein